MRILQVDAFTTTPFAGNAAGVVLDAAGLTDAQMQLVAREMNVSETVFLLPASRTDADLRLRWFTPTVEVDLCGHATVACFHAAMEEGRLAPGRFRLECLAGLLPVRLERDVDGRPLVSLGLPVPEMRRWDIATCRLAEPLGLDTDDISDRLPVARCGKWAVVPVTGLDAMNRIRPDSNAVRALGLEEGVGELIALTTETVDRASRVHVRMFAPACGIDEDPVTGAAQGPVAAWMSQNDLLDLREADAGVRHASYVAEQGDELGRPGRIEVDVEIASSRVASITITGRAVTVMSGLLQFDPG